MKNLYKTASHKKIAGICGGIGEMMDIDPTIVRLLAIMGALLTGVVPFVVGYLIAWWIVPPGSQDSSGVRQGA